jgi:hypothetical protein
MQAIATEQPVTMLRTQDFTCRRGLAQRVPVPSPPPGHASSRHIPSRHNPSRHLAASQTLPKHPHSTCACSQQHGPGGPRGRRQARLRVREVAHREVPPRGGQVPDDGRAPSHRRPHPAQGGQAGQAAAHGLDEHPGPARDAAQGAPHAQLPSALAWVRSWQGRTCACSSEPACPMGCVVHTCNVDSALQGHDAAMLQT